MNVHSALAMKDGNVVVIDSYGWVLILYRNGLQGFANTFKIHLKYPHGVVWDKEYQMLYVLAYTDIIKYKYIGQGANASLELVHDYDFKKYYERCSFYGICDEDAATEDGGHDFFPVKGDNPHLFFLTTGERVFLFDSSQQLDTLNLNSAQNTEIMLKNYSALFQIDSKYSQQITPNAIKEQVILQKGGIKSISGNLNSAKYCVIATPRPWFTSNLYYPYDSTVLVYIDNPNSIVDFDLSTHNHIYFESDLNSEVNFYKARLF